MHTSSVGCGVSAEIDTMADTVTPCRPATPSVVTTLTVQAAWLIPCRNFWRSARSTGDDDEDRASVAVGSVPLMRDSRERGRARDTGATRCAGHVRRTRCTGVFREPLIDRTVAGGPLGFSHHALRQIRRLLDEVQWSVPIEIAVYGIQMCERRRLSEELEGQA